MNRDINKLMGETWDFQVWDTSSFIIDQIWWALSQETLGWFQCGSRSQSVRTIHSPQWLMWCSWIYESVFLPWRYLNVNFNAKEPISCGVPCFWRLLRRCCWTGNPDCDKDEFHPKNCRFKHNSFDSGTCVSSKKDQNSSADFGQPGCKTHRLTPQVTWYQTGLLSRSSLSSRGNSHSSWNING